LLGFDQKLLNGFRCDFAQEVLLVAQILLYPNPYVSVVFDNTNGDEEGGKSRTTYSCGIRTALFFPPKVARS
jgi:hypothetical protein